MSSWVLLSDVVVVDDCWSMRELMMLSEWIMDIVNGPLVVVLACSCSGWSGCGCTC